MWRRVLGAAGALALAALIGGGGRAAGGGGGAGPGVGGPWRDGALTLRDARGTPFGTVVEADASRSPVRVGFIESFVVPSSGRLTLVVLSASPRGIEAGALGQEPRLYFEGRDCAGRPLVLGFPAGSERIPSFWGLFTAAAVVPAAGAPGRLELWVAADETAREVELASALHGGRCEPLDRGPSPRPRPARAFAAELVDPDLHATFPPPYRLGGRAATAPLPPPEAVGPAWAAGPAGLLEARGWHGTPPPAR